MAESDRAFDYKVAKILTTDTRYAQDSFRFIKEAVAFAHEIHTRKPGRKGHLSIEKLVDSIRVFALCEYGPMARAVLSFWGIKSTEDFGNLIFLLADADELELSDSDTIDKFRDVFSFDTAFEEPFVPGNTPVNVPKLDEE